MSDAGTMDLVVRLSEEQFALEAEIARRQEELNDLTRKLKKIREEDLPEAVDALEWEPETMYMDPAGDQVSVRLRNGLMVSVSDAFHPHLSRIHRAEALQWIMENGGDSLLATDLTLSFPRGDGAALTNTLAVLKQLDPERPMTVETTIHPQTLRKFCREKVREGANIPDIIGLFHQRTAFVADAPQVRRITTPLAVSHDYP